MKKILLVILSLFAANASAGDFEKAKQAILKMTGCYIVDYSYSETKALKDGYKLDSRVYDVNRDKNVKEWIYPVFVSENQIRLQHVLFMSDLNGNVNPETFLKHQAEDWDYNAAFWYEFTSPSKWEPRTLSASGTWVRRITNLDDGLRHQCVAGWKLDSEYAEWRCSSFAPIPGRETRDMGRKDYNTMDRTTKLVIYGSSFLERQDNIKTVYQDDAKTPLAQEHGKNWYVKIPDSECSAAIAWAKPRSAFWELLRQTWEEIFNEQKSFYEKSVPGQPPRFVGMMAIEEKYKDLIAQSPEHKEAARKEIRALIESYRK